MAKLLSGIHVIVFSLIALHSGRETFYLVIKILAPSSEHVRYWKPGLGAVIVPLGLCVVLTLLGHSTGALKGLSTRALANVTAVWLFCLTWYGWFSLDSPFRLHELIDVDFNDPAAVKRAELSHLIWGLITYLFLVSVSLVPILLQRRASRTEPSGVGRKVDRS
jgi:hypothetical protein